MWEICNKLNICSFGALSDYRYIKLYTYYDIRVHVYVYMLGILYKKQFSFYDASIHSIDCSLCVLEESLYCQKKKGDMQIVFLELQGNKILMLKITTFIIKL